ncbi:hypothetical protein BDZ45DRAFT_674558 [Acephala macrosclerotiorum]|nr:hypothetical protein BDZ45DRAFT_674558 [Acephala macrosclerotiorum]
MLPISPGCLLGLSFSVALEMHAPTLSERERGSIRNGNVILRGDVLLLVTSRGRDHMVKMNGAGWQNGDMEEARRIVSDECEYVEGLGPPHGEL